MSSFLDWHDRSHWARAEAPCRFCWQPTHLRDDYGRPSHKTCAEAHPEQTAIPPKHTKKRSA